MSVKPNFFIIGAPKAGTTSMWDLLRRHPDIFMPKQKEPAFFSLEKVYARGWSWYESLFDEGAGNTAIGEATPNYSRVESYPAAPRRIAKYFPEARLIYIVRDPLERILSGYLQCLSTRHPMPRSFSLAIRQYPPLVESTLYWRNINAYRQYFSDERILVILFEEFRENPSGVLERCYRFLDVDPTFKANNMRTPRNPSAGKKMKRRGFAVLHGVPGSPYIKEVVPELIKRIIKNWGMISVPPPPEWDIETRRWALNQVRENAEAILEYIGKPIDFWRLNDESD